MNRSAFGRINWVAVREVAEAVFWMACVAAFFYVALVFCSIAEPGTAPMMP